MRKYLIDNAIPFLLGVALALLADNIITATSNTIVKLELIRKEA